MSAKEILLDVAGKLPPDATISDAIHELEFRQAVQQGWMNWIVAKPCLLKKSKPGLPNGLENNHRPRQRSLTLPILSAMWRSIILMQQPGTE
jgi:hypothetical protein